jgi:AsmA protein
MKKPARWLGAAFLAAGVLAAVAPWTISGSALRRDIAAQASRKTGLSVEETGRAVFALLPRPRVKIEGLRATGFDGAVDVRADFLRGDLRVLPLLAGRIELANVSLVSPSFEVDVDRVVAAPPKTPAAGALSTIAIVDGRAILRRSSGAARWEFRDIDLTMDMAGLASPLNARGTFGFRGQPFSASLWVGRARTGSWPIVARVESPVLTANFDGDSGGGTAPGFTGDASIKIASLATTLTDLGIDIPGLEPLGGLSVASPIRVAARTIDFSDVRLALAGTRFDGALALSTAGEKPRVSGTLATADIDLAPFAQLLPRLRGPDGGWSAEPLPLAALDCVDVDVRASAGRARLGPLEATAAGLSIFADEGRFEASLAGATAYRGLVEGRLVATAAPGGVSARVDTRFSDVDIGAALTAARRAKRVSGSVSGQIVLEGVGGDAAALVGGLRGSARMSAVGGDLDGLDLEQALRRVERRPLTIMSELRGGRTKFDHAVANLAIENGLVHVERAEAEGAGAVVDVEGSLSIRNRDMALRLRATQAPSASAPATGDAPRIAVEIDGPWDAPSLSLDTQSLIQRSQAAAPLWDAAKSKAAATLENRD